NEGATGGVDAAGGSVTIYNSELFGNQGQDGGAVRIRPNCNVQILYCDIFGNQANNKGGAIYVDVLSPASTTAIINQCRIFDNQSSVSYDVESAVYINAQRNWWGDSSGPSGTGTYRSGSGDSASPESVVECFPWLVS